MKKGVFEIQPQQWIGCRTVPDLRIGWSSMSASPVFVTAAEPLKTGKGILRIKLIPISYPTGPSEISSDLRIIHHREGYVVGVAKEFAGAEHTLILEAISFDWLERHCPTIHARMMSGWWKPETVQEGLEHRYGTNQRKILHVASSSDFPAEFKTSAMPKKHASLGMNREFSEYESYLISKGLIPKDMDDKWLIFRRDDTLFFYRSWTGICIYEVSLQMRGARIYFSHCRINRNLKQYPGKSNEYDLSMINWLVDELLLGKPSPQPIEPEFIVEEDGEED
jgi:hypothetical protein